MHELGSQVIHSSSIAEEGGGKNRYKLPGSSRPEGGPGPKLYYIYFYFWLVRPCRGGQRIFFFHRAPSPLSATLTSRHIETCQICLVIVFRPSSTQICRSLFSQCYHHCPRSRYTIPYSACKFVLRPYK